MDEGHVRGGVPGDGDGASPAGADAPRVRVGVLDEHGFAVAALARWIARHALDLQLTAAATTWADFVQEAGFPTDVVLLDLDPVSSVSIAARIRSSRSTGAVVLAVSSDDAPATVARARDAGAVGVVVRSSPPELVVAAIRAALAGEGPAHPPRDGVVRRPKLSPGEERALRLYASGFSTVEVGRQMNVQYETAKTYLRRVREKYAKVGRPASKKIELIRRASEDGILD